MDRCITCLWFQEISDEELRSYLGRHKNGYCRVYPTDPNPITVNKHDFCGLHRPRRTGWELRIGSWLFRFEYKRVG